MKYLATAFTLLASTALASDGNLKQATAVVMSINYDSKCEALPVDFMMSTYVVMGQQSPADLAVATQIIKNVIAKESLKGFCGRTKPSMDWGITEMRKLLNK